MKPRRLVLTIELENDLPLPALKSAARLVAQLLGKVFQVQANVIRGKR